MTEWDRGEGWANFRGGPRFFCFLFHHKCGLIYRSTDGLPHHTTRVAPYPSTCRGPIRTMGKKNNKSKGKGTTLGVHIYDLIWSRARYHTLDQ